MRPLLVLLLVAACADAGHAPIRGDGGPDDDEPDARLSADARPPADAASAAVDALPPSTANVGWIGGSCTGPAQCPYSGGVCLSEGFTNGLCTRECTGVCPDRTQPGDTQTGCVDGIPFGFDQGVCVSRCDRQVLPPEGCAAGFRCAKRHRYRDETWAIIEVCVPDGTPDECSATGKEDELVRIDYPDRGMLWIPAEAQCGGDFPLVVMMHGINGGKNPTPSLGGGRNLQVLVRALIDAHLMEPVLLAEPVQTNDAAASSTGLYAPQYFEPATHLDRVKPHLTSRSIALKSLSYIGHSGAGCSSANGLYLVLKRYAQLIPVHAPILKLWGLEDVCYESAYHWTAPMTALSGKGVTLLNVWSGQEDPTAFENNLFPQAMDVPCAQILYSKCIRHATESWCSYRTKTAAGINHDRNPYFFIREAFPQVFPIDAAIKACR